MTAQQIETVLDGVLHDCVLCSDAAAGYRKYASTKQIPLQVLNATRGAKKYGLYHLKNVNAYHSRLKRWINPFDGVSTKYLPNYLVWFQRQDSMGCCRVRRLRTVLWITATCPRCSLQRTGYFRLEPLNKWSMLEMEGDVTKVRGSKIVIVVALIAIANAGCGHSLASKKVIKSKAVSTPTEQQTTATSAFPDQASKACALALKAVGVPEQSLSLPESVSGSAPSWRKVRLSPMLTGGPEVQGVASAQRAYMSPLQAAYENFLSSAVGYPLTGYLGTTVTEVDLSGGRQGMAGYVCLEKNDQVAGMWGQQSGYTAQPEFLVSARDETFQSLAGTDFLSWLIQKGYYSPHAVPNNSSFTAERALENMFAVMNDQSLSDAQRAQLLATYYEQPQQTTSPDPLLALVPMGISQFPGVTPPDPQTQQEFGVALWPHWRNFPPKTLAGNGLQYMFYVMARPPGASMWKIQSEGTGP